MVIWKQQSFSFETFWRSHKIARFEPNRWGVITIWYNFILKGFWVNLFSKVEEVFSFFLIVFRLDGLTGYLVVPGITLRKQLATHTDSRTPRFALLHLISWKGMAWEWLCPTASGFLRCGSSIMRRGGFFNSGKASSEYFFYRRAIAGCPIFLPEGGRLYLQGRCRRSVLPSSGGIQGQSAASITSEVLPSPLGNILK